MTRIYAPIGIILSVFDFFFFILDIDHGRCYGIDYIIVYINIYTKITTRKRFLQRFRSCIRKICYSSKHFFKNIKKKRKLSLFVISRVWISMC